MWTAIGITSVVCFLIGLAIVLARREGRKAEKLEALKRELKRQEEEKERAEKITSTVISMDEHTVRNKLHEIANKQQ